ncbi:hypothetical protein HYFRA_00008018 [Hymenoscyphus fraxineus]|uniref:Nuclear GTPase SLIP-GC n=1 Tax=Hymenoscyphus fraxineus TaxID=746836 RepID=A0A9N9KP08_9HELO|nr:hypothetical protein HYFRA_00008018 [Hymenoscyphus fraxineus]
MAPGRVPQLGSIHALARQHIPPGAQLDGDSFFVMVLPHDECLETCATEKYIWYKVKSKYTIAKLKDEYYKRNNHQVNLFYDGVGVGDILQVQTLNFFGDHIVAFTARLVERNPLAPVASGSPVMNSMIQSPVAMGVVKSENRDFGSGVYGVPRTSTPNSTLAAHQRTSAVKSEPVGSPATPQRSINAPAPSPISRHTPQDNGNHQKMDIDDEPVPELARGQIANRLHELIETATPDALEAEVRNNKAFIESLLKPFEASGVASQDSKHWVTQLNTLKNHNVNTPTIIGVVGNTGAGKSSVINAILDEERLVPTNCMRACTAVVTEMSFNHSENEREKYRAEIEFIKPEDWEKDLQLSLSELKNDSGGLSSDYTTPDSEAGIAYAKIKAVYPHKTREMLASCTVEQLMNETAIKKVLGTTIKVAKPKPDDFYRELQSYVDSKEKSGDKKKKKKKGEKSEPKTMEFWPMIKVVRIYVKADALSTGAILVDLPGVHDSNAARAAVAAGYLKKCTGLWVVAPIGRAVDDKAAKNLLGESFKRQLKYDGIYSRVTFICSKTDDISITEASDSLGLEDQMADDWKTMDSIKDKKKELKKTIEDTQESKAVYAEVINDADDQIEIWEKLLEELQGGKTVYAPSKAPEKKRKRSAKPEKSNKKAKKSKSKEHEGSDDDDDFIDDGDEDEDAEENEDSDDDEDEAGSDAESNAGSTSDKDDPLTEEVIEEKITQLKGDKKKARRERAEIDLKVKALKEEQTALTKTYEELETKMSAVCIAGRNDYSKTAIQTDFAAGIKELDQENAQEEDEETFNPDEDIRDYEEVARSLPVFCVSSRAYQKLCGRMQRDANVPGFRTAEETEVPQLKAHCKKLTEGGRASNCRRFLTDLSQLINSLTLWSSNDGTGLNMSSTQMAAESRFLKSRLQNLEKNLDKSVTECLEEMKQTLAENIFDSFDGVVQQAVTDANTTSTRWGDRHMGGFYWATYKALCRRNGVFANKNGEHDLNHQLTEPIIKGLANNWEKAFARKVPHVLGSFARKSKTLLHQFHKEIEGRSQKAGLGVAGLGMLSQQLRNYEATFAQLGQAMVDLISNAQREANREFTPVVAEALVSSYEFCAAEVGPGQFVRMKRHMNDHIEQNKNTMFQQSVDGVKARLTAMCRSVENEMASKAEEVWSTMNRDYTQVISGTQLPDGEQMPKWERLLRAELVKIIRERGEFLKKAAIQASDEAAKAAATAAYLAALEGDGEGEGEGEGADKDEGDSRDRDETAEEGAMDE